MKKKLLSIALAMALAAAVFGAAGAATRTASAEFVGTGEGPLSRNLVAPWVNGTILDTYNAAGGDLHTTYDCKFGKVGDVFTHCYTSGSRFLVNGLSVLAAMPLSVLPKAGAEFEASATVTTVSDNGWGGFGIQIGWGADDKPVGIYIDETKAVELSASGTEIKRQVTTGAGAVIPDLTAETEYAFKVTVIAGTLTLYINDTQSCAIVLATYIAAALPITPAIGAQCKNWSADYTDFSLKVWGDGYDEPEPGDTPLTPDDYTALDNYFVDSIGVLFTYGANNNFKQFQPFPVNYGLNFAKLAAGYYAPAGNNLQEHAQTYTGVSYLGTSVDVSGVSDYMVSASIKPTTNTSWGGLGLCIGRDAGTGAPIMVWVNMHNPDAPTDSGSNPLSNIWVGYGWNDLTATFASKPSGTFAVNRAYTMTVIVENRFVSVYIDGAAVGDAKELPASIDLEVVFGAFVKNYGGQFSDFVFKTTAEDLAPATYTARIYSDVVLLNEIEYTYGQVTQLSVPPRLGFTYAGFALTPNMSGATITEIPANTAGNINIFTGYTLIKYSITYYDGDKLITGAGLEFQYDVNSYVLLPEIEKEGYIFEGWFTSADFSGAAVEDINMQSTGDKVFYAKYKAKSSGTTDPGKTPGKETGNCKKASLGIFAALTALSAAAVIFKKKR